MIKNFKNSGFCCLHDWHGRACFCCPYSVSVTRSRCAGKFLSLQALFQLTNFNCSQQTPARCFQIVLNEVWSFCEHLRGSLEPRSPAKRQFYEFLAIIRLVLYNSIWVVSLFFRFARLFSIDKLTRRTQFHCFIGHHHHHLDLQRQLFNWNWLNPTDCLLSFSIFVRKVSFYPAGSEGVVVGWNVKIDSWGACVKKMSQGVEYLMENCGFTNSSFKQIPSKQR